MRQRAVPFGRLVVCVIAASVYWIASSRQDKEFASAVPSTVPAAVISAFPAENEGGPRPEKPGEAMEFYRFQRTRGGPIDLSANRRPSLGFIKSTN